MKSLSAAGGEEFSRVVDARSGDGAWENFASYVFTCDKR